MHTIRARVALIGSAILIGFATLPTGPTLKTQSALVGPAPHRLSTRTADKETEKRIRDACARLPLRFEMTGGSDTEFVARGAGYLVNLTSGDAKLVIGAVGDTDRTPIAMRLAGASPGIAGSGRKLLPGVANHLIGNDPRRWKIGIRSYAEVEYRNVYPGVNIVYYGNQGELEFDLVVAPGASYGDIQLEFAGATGLYIDEEGNLIIETDAGDLVQQAPFIYQEQSGNRRQIAGGYVLRADRRVGFEVAPYDASLPLVIDPVLAYSSYLGGTLLERLGGVAVDNAGSIYVTGLTGAADISARGAATYRRGRDYWDVFVAKLSATADAYQYITYLGGWGMDEPRGIGVDVYGNAIVTGWTWSSDFPTVKAMQPFLLGYTDSFITKLDANGAIVYSTYFGGSGAEYGNGIAVDAAGRAHVTGTTYSGDFPTRNAFQSSLGGSRGFRTTDGGDTWAGMSGGLRSAISFFAIDPIATAVVYAATHSDGVLKSVDGGTTWMSTSADLPAVPVKAMVVDPSGALYVANDAGLFRSRDQGATWIDVQFWMPISALAVDAASGVIYAGLQQWSSGVGVFMSSDGGHTWNFLGDPSNESGFSLEVTSLTVSHSVVYAGTPTGVFKSIGGNGLYPASTGLPEWEWVTSLASDPTNSDVAFVGTYNGLFYTMSGGAEWLPVDPLWSASVRHVAIAASNPSTLYVATGSSGTSWMSDDGGASWQPTGPSKTAFSYFAVDPTDARTVYAAAELTGDVFISRLSADGSELEYSTYLGGSTWESEPDIAIDEGGNAYVAGATQSDDFPVLNPVQSAAGGGWEDVFVAKISHSGDLVYATYLGGRDSDYNVRIAVDAAGRAHVAGLTRSADFPTVNAFQTTLGGRVDAFVTTLNETGTGFVYSTFVGGTDDESDWFYGPGIAVWSSGESVISGTTKSFDFPTRNALQAARAGGVTDAFVTKFDASGGVEFSTYLGGTGYDSGRRVAIDATGAVIVAGVTSSTDFPTQGALQATNAGGEDAFIARIEADPRDTFAPTTTVIPSGVAGSNGWYRSSVTVALAAQDDSGGSGVATIEYSIDGGAFQHYNGPFTITVEGRTTVRARAIDRAGNIEEPAAAIEIAIDTTPPVITTHSPGSVDYLHSATVQVSFDVADAVSGLEIGGPVATLDSAEVANGLAIQPLTLALGSHTLSVTASDQAGNIASRAVQFPVIATIGSLRAAVSLLVAQGQIGSQIASSLLAKLTEAQEALDRGAMSAVQGTLGAFSREVAAQTGRSIVPAAGRLLQQDVQYVLAAI
jgi:hypothetical protein